jgi:acetyl-CoA carboxylase biotin carboxyl carrier protein
MLTSRVPARGPRGVEEGVDSNQLRELIEIISRSEFSTFELEQDGFKLKLVKANAQAASTTIAATAVPSAAAPLAPAAVEEARPPAVDPTLVEQKSPIVGTYYRAPSPDAPPFVEVGSRVKKGQVLCIVEAMKLMNEIEAELDGEIVEILVSNGQPVEYGEVLFRIRPSG